MHVFLWSLIAALLLTSYPTHAALLPTGRDALNVVRPGSDASDRFGVDAAGDPGQGCSSGGDAGLLGGLLVLGLLLRRRTRRSQDPAQPVEDEVLDYAIINEREARRALLHARAKAPVHRRIRWLALLFLTVWTMPQLAEASTARTLSSEALLHRADVRPDACEPAPGGEGRKACSEHRRGAFEAVSHPQFEQIFGANLLK